MIARAKNFQITFAKQWITPAGMCVFLLRRRLCNSLGRPIRQTSRTGCNSTVTRYRCRKVSVNGWTNQEIEYDDRRNQIDSGQLHWKANGRAMPHDRSLHDWLHAARNGRRPRRQRIFHTDQSSNRRESDTRNMVIKLLGQGSLYDIHRMKQKRQSNEWARVIWFLAAFTLIAAMVIGWILL